MKKDYIYFLGIFSVIFLISLATFSITGLAPEGYRLIDYLERNEPIQNFGEAFDYETTNIDSSVLTYTRPDRIVIDKIGVDTIVANPNTRDVAELDRYLLQGAVHYPGSGTVERGNMFLFAHSTGLQFVQNQAYKAFNNLNKLTSGDEITIIADGQEYTYKVKTVKLVDENSALVRFDKDKRMLTLSTCNTFGAKQERWVVEAEFYQ